MAQEQFYGEIGGDGGARVPQEAPRLIAPVAQNGAVQPIRMIVRTAEIKLGEPYEGMSATMRLNPRRSVIDELSSGETQRVTKAIHSLIQRWVIFDEEGQAVPLSAEAVYDLPDDLLSALIQGYFAHFQQAVTPSKSD